MSYDESYSRWNVVFDIDGESALLKDAKLEVLRRTRSDNDKVNYYEVIQPGTKVAFVELSGTKLDKYNGTTGDALAFNRDIGRWRVRFDSDGVEAYVNEGNMKCLSTHDV